MTDFDFDTCNYVILPIKEINQYCAVTISNWEKATDLMRANIKESKNNLVEVEVLLLAKNGKTEKYQLTDSIAKVSYVNLKGVLIELT